MFDSVSSCVRNRLESAGGMFRYWPQNELTLEGASYGKATNRKTSGKLFRFAIVTFPTKICNIRFSRWGGAFFARDPNLNIIVHLL